MPDNFLRTERRCLPQLLPGMDSAEEIIDIIRASFASFAGTIGIRSAQELESVDKAAHYLVLNILGATIRLA